MKETLKLIFTLSLICLIAGAMLAGINNVTKKPIEQAKAAKKQAAIKAVLPPCDNAPDQNTCAVTNNGTVWTFYVARNKGEFCGAAVEAVSNKGYGGNIALMLGIKANGHTQGIAILQQTETPGLGANIEGDKFQSNFKNKDLKNTKWQVKKDGGDVDQITAATISSRAVTGAIKAAIEAYLANIDKIKATGSAGK